MKRFVCIYFPKWPLQRLEADRPELRRQAFVLAGLKRGRPAAMLCSEAAAREGVRRGMPVAEALATCPGLPVIDEDAHRDRQALQDLAHWAERFSPIVGLEDSPTPECLLLDVTGCAACFGGEDKLLQRIDREFKTKGWYVRVAVADTVGAAWALAHFADTSPQPLSPNWATRERDLLEAALGPLPVEALRLPGEVVELLHSLGLERIKALLALSRAGLADRLGQEVVTRLDQAFGRLPEIVTAYRQLPEIHIFYSLPYATDRLGLLKKIMKGLIEHVCRLLEERKQGVRQLECRLYYEEVLSGEHGLAVNGEEPVHRPIAANPWHPAERVDYFQVGLVRASRSPSYLGPLVQTRLEGVRPAGPINALGLFARVTEPLFAEQGDFFQSSEGRHELAELIDNLNSRLGRDAVTRPVLVPDAQPEFAYRLEAVNLSSQLLSPKRRKGLLLPSLPWKRGAGGEGVLPRRGRQYPLTPTPLPQLDDQLGDRGERLLPRPARLLSRPVSAAVVAVFPEGPPARFRWEGQEHRIVQAWGPERIETGWWRDQDVQRDYYQVMTETGVRFWLFRRRSDGRWFVHGYFE